MSEPKKILKYYEDYNYKLNSKIIYTLLEEFSKLTDYNFYSGSDINIIEEFDGIVDKYTHDPKYQIIFINLLKKYNFNMLSIIKYAIGELTDLKDPNNNAEAIKKLLLHPLINDISFDGNKSFSIYSSILGLISFDLASSIMKSNKDITNYMNTRVLNGICHDNTCFLVNKIKELSAITSLCELYFKGYYYHSYALFDNNCIIDLTYKIIMNKDTYYKLFRPKEVSVVKGYDLEMNLSLANKYFNPKDDFCALIKIALYNQYLSIKDTDEMAKINMLIK